MKLSLDQWLRTEYRPIAGAETAPAEPAAETGTEAGGEPAEPAGPDLSPVLDRMDEVSRQLGTLEERLPQPEQTPEQELYGAPYGQQPGTPEWDQGQQQQQQQGQQFDPEDPEAAVMQLIQTEAARAAEARIAPELARQAQERRETETQQLLDDYPALQDQSQAQALVTDAGQWAQDITRDIARGNPQLAQSLASEPAFLELVHLAAQQAERAEGETPPAPAQDQVTLEGGAPANPGGGTPQANLGEQIKNAGKPAGFWTG